MTSYPGFLRVLRPQQKSGHMIRGQAEHEIGVNQFAFVTHFFVFIQTREWRARSGAAECKCGSAFAVWNAPLPIQWSATLLAKRRHDLT